MMGETKPKTRTKTALTGATRKGVETRNRIIKGAREALEQGGMEALTTRRIAASAGVKLATLHYYFDSKESLLLAVLEDLIADMEVTYRQDVALPEAPEDRVEALIRASWRYIQRTRNKQISQTELTLYALRTKGSEWLAARQYNAYIDFYGHLVFVDDRDEDLRRIGRAVARQMLIGIDGIILQSYALQDLSASNDDIEALITAMRGYLRRLLVERDKAR
ncbi:TetR/AcrR family transcriptional regulator [Peteryoungia algae]|jgi:AcrR family transcriptional regulator|uniref:TetR/AcrR family transcriptional regulator n=1 Tax=Peteryoungia algae TaxID=2919917 RepID=A0ABT0CY84_9HYPH|nr:TetR/AcrR family transcriptional regulator [Rhizobium sp. SSM4.3]MCJ8238100.1 TetR/AcrR family transcriptional regulator [Rhizobium sp. SSM4.3]